MDDLGRLTTLFALVVLGCTSQRLSLGGPGTEIGLECGSAELALEAERLSFEPYVEALPEGLVQGTATSFYQEPWRGWLETSSAEVLRNGLSVRYIASSDQDVAAVAGLLASSGVARISFDVGWDAFGMNEDIAHVKGWLGPALSAAYGAGLRVSTLLHAHSWLGSGPSSTTTRVVRQRAGAGSRELVLDDVAGLAAYKSGLNLSESKLFAGLLFASIEAGTGRVQLGRALPAAIDAGQKVEIGITKYAPLFPPGTAEFEETAAGWLSFVDEMISLHQTYDVAFDLEHLYPSGFRSEFEWIDNYFDPPLYPTATATHAPGGSAWELARRSAARLRERAPSSRLVWSAPGGRASLVDASTLPEGVASLRHNVPAAPPLALPQDAPAASVNGGIEGSAPTATLFRPEGSSTLALEPAGLMSVIHPEVRGRVGREMTLSFAPSSSPALAPEPPELWKARGLLRSSLFWANKGASSLVIHQVYEDSDDGAGVLLSGSAAAPGAKLEESPFLASFRRSLALLGAPGIEPGAVIDGLTVGPIQGDESLVEGPRSKPLSSTLAALPFSVDDRRVAIALYFLGYDFSESMTGRRVLLRFTSQFGCLGARYYDPIADQELPFEAYGSNGALTVALTVADSPRWLVISR